MVDISSEFARFLNFPPARECHHLKTKPPDGDCLLGQHCTMEAWSSCTFSYFPRRSQSQTFGIRLIECSENVAQYSNRKFPTVNVQFPFQIDTGSYVHHACQRKSKSRRCILNQLAAKDKEYLRPKKFHIIRNLF